MDVPSKFQSRFCSSHIGALLIRFNVIFKYVRKIQYIKMKND